MLELAKRNHLRPQQRLMERTAARKDTPEGVGALPVHLVVLVRDQDRLHKVELFRFSPLASSATFSASACWAPMYLE